MGTTVPTDPTPVDASISASQWTRAHIVRVEVVPVDDRMRRNPLWEVQRLARWAVLGRDQFHASHLLATDADRVGAIVAFARAVAMAEDAEFIEPLGVCEYCGAPTSTAGARWCLPAPGRDCERLDRGREWRVERERPLFGDRRAA